MYFVIKVHKQNYLNMDLYGLISLILKMDKIQLNQAFNTFEEFQVAFDLYIQATHTLWKIRSSALIPCSRNYKLKEFKCVYTVNPVCTVNAKMSLNIHLESIRSME